MDHMGLMSRAPRTLACLAAELSGVARFALPLHGASVAVPADENTYRLRFLPQAAVVRGTAADGLRTSGSANREMALVFPIVVPRKDVP
jgi:hypothetical protein